MLKGAATLVLVLVLVGAVLGVALREALLCECPSVPPTLPVAPVQPALVEPGGCESCCDQALSALEEVQAGLDQERRELDQREAELKAKEEWVAQEEARLQRWEAELTAREQRVEGLLRWLVAAAVILGVLVGALGVILAGMGRRV
jgi:hypothetical protein